MELHEFRQLLLKGVRAWNQWRADHPSVVPILEFSRFDGRHLVGINLASCQLRGCSFAGANLLQATLVGADLSGAVFDEAFLMDVDARGAVLNSGTFKYAFLQQADFSNASATGADFEGADFYFANLSGATLRGANVTLAIFGETGLSDCDLSALVGARAARHVAASGIDTRTIIRSSDLDREFLVAAGVAELVTENVASIRGKPIEFYSCFISYSVADEEFAARLHSELKSNNIRTWYAPEDLHIGDKFRQAIDGAIKVRDKLLLVLSERSLKSDWVAQEVETAFEEEVRRGKPILFPIRLDDAIMNTDESWAATIRRTRHIGDFRNWKQHDEYKGAFQRLLRDLKMEDRKEALDHIK